MRHSLGSNTITAEKVGVLEVDLAVQVRELEPLMWMMEREELVEHNGGARAGYGRGKLG